MIFWATSIDDINCEIQKKAEIVEQEVKRKERFKVENISSPRRCFLYLLNNYISLAIQNDETCHLSPQEHKQLELFLELLQEQTIPGPKKRQITPQMIESFTQRRKYISANL